MFALYLIVLIIVLWIATSSIQAHKTGIPGPWYTNITSLVLKYHEISRGRRLWIHSLHGKYGPVVRLAPNEVSFANLEGMKEIYQSGGSGYDKTEFYDLFKQYGQRTMFSTLNKYDHAQRKKLFADRYAMTNILQPQIMDGIYKRTASVIEKCHKSFGQSVNVYVLLHCYALDCASHFLFNPGGTNSLNDQTDLNLMKELSYHDSLRQRWLDYYCPQLTRFAAIFKRKSTPQAKQFVLDQANRTYTGETSLLGRLQSKSTNLVTVQMAAECMDHMAAGIDTTGDGLCFLMYELSLPGSTSKQQRLHEEIIRNPEARLDELVYLDAVVKEGLRLFSPIPMSLPRYVPHGGRVISGYPIPAGSIVSCQAYSLHRMNDHIFPDPETFSPERWLDKEGELERNRAFFAFAAGGRGCVGKNLALVEMKTLLREIYSRFETSVPAEMQADMSIDDQIIASRPKDQVCLLSFKDIGGES